MHAMGIDLGGSGFRLGVFDTETGETVREVEAHRHGSSTAPEAVVAALANVLGDMDWKGPMGIGFPGAVEKNTILTAPNLGDAWCGFDLHAALASFHEGRLAVLNDADAVAEGERRFGQGHGTHSTVLTLTVGTGLGTTVHQDGSLVPNLEYGRLPHPSRTGVLEEHLSGKARTEEGLSLEAWCLRFQEGLTFLEDLVSPTLVVLYGGIMEHWEAIRPRLEATAHLEPAQLLHCAGPLGAAAWVADQAAD